MFLKFKICPVFVGFGFVSFETEDVVEQICSKHYYEINNKMVCKRNPIFLLILAKFSSDWFEFVSFGRL